MGSRSLRPLHQMSRDQEPETSTLEVQEPETSTPEVKDPGPLPQRFGVQDPETSTTPWGTESMEDVVYDWLWISEHMNPEIPIWE